MCLLLDNVEGSQFPTTTFTQCLPVNELDNFQFRALFMHSFVSLKDLALSTLFAALIFIFVMAHDVT